MAHRAAALFALALLCASADRALAEPAGRVVIHPWQDLVQGFAGSFSGETLMLHATAATTAPALVLGADAPVQEYFQRHDPIGQRFADATLGIGWFTPIVIPAALYFGGLAGDASELATAGAAAVQAAVVQAVIVSALKWLTDRAGPYPDGRAERARWSEGLFRDSRDPGDFNFNPFDISGGLRWPSGHTASNIALVSALVAFYPDQPWIAALGYPAVLAIGLGMIEGDYHWLSDVIAGALIGHAIGWTIGKRFRARYDAAVSGKRERASWHLQPSAALSGAGLSLVYAPD